MTMYTPLTQAYAISSKDSEKYHEYENPYPERGIIQGTQMVR